MSIVDQGESDSRNDRVGDDTVGEEPVPVPVDDTNFELEVSNEVEVKEPEYVESPRAEHQRSAKVVNISGEIDVIHEESIDGKNTDGGTGLSSSTEVEDKEDPLQIGRDLVKVGLGLESFSFIFLICCFIGGVCMVIFLVGVVFALASFIFGIFSIFGTIISLICTVLSIVLAIAGVFCILVILVGSIVSCISWIIKIPHAIITIIPVVIAPIFNFVGVPFVIIMYIGMSMFLLGIFLAYFFPFNVIFLVGGLAFTIFGGVFSCIFCVIIAGALHLFGHFNSFLFWCTCFLGPATPCIPGFGICFLCCDLCLIIVFLCCIFLCFVLAWLCLLCVPIMLVVFVVSVVYSVVTGVLVFPISLVLTISGGLLFLIFIFCGFFVFCIGILTMFVQKRILNNKMKTRNDLNIGEVGLKELTDNQEPINYQSEISDFRKEDEDIPENQEGYINTNIGIIQSTNETYESEIVESPQPRPGRIISDIPDMEFRDEVSVVDNSIPGPVLITISDEKPSIIPIADELNVTSEIPSFNSGDDILPRFDVL